MAVVAGVKRRNWKGRGGRGLYLVLLIPIALVALLIVSASIQSRKVRPALHVSHRDVATDGAVDASSALVRATTTLPSSPAERKLPRARASNAVPISTKPAAPACLAREDWREALLDDSILDAVTRFGMMRRDDVEGASRAAIGWMTEHNGTYVKKWWNHTSNPNRFAPLFTVKWRRGAMLAQGIEQIDEPQWDRKDDQQYFKGYVYAQPVACPGTPFQCTRHGVCDSKRGSCVCRPPWTGWACQYNFLEPREPLWAADTVHREWKRGACGAEVITDAKVEKWSERAVKRCGKKSGAAKGGKVNGMWLGMTQDHSRTIALSISNALGLHGGQVVFDVGMGCGDMLQHMALVNPQLRVVGVDYSQPAVELVRERFQDLKMETDADQTNKVFCVADVRNMSFIPSNSVDAAFESGAFSATRDKHCETYRDVVRILRPGGTLLIHQTYHDGHPVKCWQNINMQSVERCLGPTGVLFEHILTRDLSGGAFDTYCAGETWALLVRKPLWHTCPNAKDSANASLSRK
jgi:precorrin-6B methylase 2